MFRLVVVSTRQNQEFAALVAKKLRISLEPIEIKTFSDGEIWCHYKKSIRDSDIYIIASTNPPADNKEELLILIDAARRAGVRRITVVIPYFGGARQDRKDKPRTPITAKKNANEIQNAGVSRVIVMDPHFDQLAGFFDIPFDTLYASKEFIPLIKKQRIPKLTVVATDAGDVARALYYARRLKAEVAFVIKERTKHNEVIIRGHVGNINKRNIIIVDDLIDTGGTFVEGIKYLDKQGANKIYGACTHPLLSGKAVGRLRECKLLTKLWVTGTLNLPPGCPDNIEVVSVANIFAQSILAAHRGKSINRLFYKDSK